MSAPFVYHIRDEKRDGWPWLGAQAVGLNRRGISKFLLRSINNTQHNDVLQVDMVRFGEIDGYLVLPPVVDHLKNVFKSRSLTGWKGEYKTHLKHSLYEYFKKTDLVTDPKT